MENNSVYDQGTIINIEEEVVEVEFTYNSPEIHDILILPGNENVKLEVYRSSTNDYRYYCFALSGNEYLSKGVSVINTHKQLLAPVDDSIFGRMIDLFGNARDGNGPTSFTNFVPIHKFIDKDITSIKSPNEIMETGIKVIDFFCPILIGGKVGLFGGAGLGKTIVLTELINNILILNSNNHNFICIFSAVGERSREAQELYEGLKKTSTLQNSTIILGQMGENPAVRSRTAYASTAIAEHFRDEKKKNILFLMDNAYRFAQAGHEVSVLMKNIPSEESYQPTLFSEMASIHERLTSNDNGSITTIEAIFVPSDDMNDYAVRTISSFLDTSIVLSRDMYQQGMLPAIDVLASISNAINPKTIDQAHYHAYIQSKILLENAAKLERVVSLIGKSELSFDDQIIYNRAILMRNYMTQNFFSTNDQTGKPGSYVNLKSTIRDVREILRGTYDEMDPEKLMYIGRIEEVT